MGYKAFFIRTFGCPLACPWCDSAGTWHKDYVPKNIDRISIEELAKEAASTNPEFVVITGGEPTIHKKTLPELSKALRSLGVRVHLETSGAFDVDASLFDWITLSPKDSKRPTRQMLQSADEFKVIVEDEHSINKWVKVIEEGTEGSSKAQSLWLHPEWSNRNNSSVLNSISNFIKKNTCKLTPKAGYQLHKLYSVDSLDPQSKPTVPLGGNIEKGY